MADEDSVRTGYESIVDLLVVFTATRAFRFDRHHVESKCRGTRSQGHHGQRCRGTRLPQVDDARYRHQAFSMQRVSVVGVPGSGKTTVGRSLSRAMGVPFIELDGLFHEPGWAEPPAEEFRARVADEIEVDAWVVDGNYHVVQEGIWERADTVVWLDLPRAVIMRRVVVRTLRRALTREELWNGNREPLTNFYRWNPEYNIIRWAWVKYPEYIRRYGSAMEASRRRSDIEWIRLSSDNDVVGFLKGQTEIMTD